MITKVILGAVAGILLLGVCIWSYRISNVDNTANETKDSRKEGDRS